MFFCDVGEEQQGTCFLVFNLQRVIALYRPEKRSNKKDHTLELSELSRKPACAASHGSRESLSLALLKLPYLRSSRYHSKDAVGTAMASQRRIAVFPSWAGMFFTSVIVGGSKDQQLKVIMLIY